MTDPAILTCQQLAISVPGRSLVEALELSVRPGEFIALLGPNGVGKTLTLHTLAGLRAPGAGSVQLFGTLLDDLPRQQIATRLALLPQHTDDVFPATVMDTAMIGRHPHIGRFRWETAEDRRIAAAALDRLGLGEFLDRDISTLSGGERRRVAVAEILAQAPQIYLLDEPTNHLDPQHQLDVLDIFRERVADGAAVIASLHDVNLASRYADRCLLLFGDGRWMMGDGDSVLTSKQLSDLYATPMESINWRDSRLFVAIGQRQSHL